MPKSERQLQVEETEGESFMQCMLLPENNYNNSIYRQGPIYNIWGDDMSNYGVPRRYSKSRQLQNYPESSAYGNPGSTSRFTVFTINPTAFC